MVKGRKHNSLQVCSFAVLTVRKMKLEGRIKGKDMSEKYIGIDLGSEFLKIAVHENNRDMPGNKRTDSQNSFGWMERSFLWNLRQNF